MKILGKIQLGKQGITENFIKSLENHFKRHGNIKVCVLKSAGHEKKKIKEYSKEILGKLGKKYTARIVGFTIFLKKWRRERE